MQENMIICMYVYMYMCVCSFVYVCLCAFMYASSQLNRNIHRSGCVSLSVSYVCVYCVIDYASKIMNNIISLLSTLILLWIF